MSASNDSRKLSSCQREVLHGTLLGDACLEWSKDRSKARIKFEQSGKHRDYLFHLYDLFRPFVKEKPVSRVRKCSTGVDCESYLFQTIKHGCFRFFGQQYLAGSSKAVPKLIHRWMTPRSFAYWFMDDGSIKSRESKGVLLNTQAFQPRDVDRLIDALGERLGLTASRRPQRDGLQIYISGKSYDRLVQLLDPFVVESMRYKIPPPRRTQMPKAIWGLSLVTTAVHLAVCWDVRSLTCFFWWLLTSANLRYGNLPSDAVSGATRVAKAIQ